MENDYSINVTKKRKATPNEVAKRLFLDKIENVFYNDACVGEVAKHCEKHYYSLKKKINLKDTIHTDVPSKYIGKVKEYCEWWNQL